jgi:Tfp pilus assembly protein PilN
MATVTYSADLDDLDAAPEDDKSRRSSRLILWLVVAGLGFLLLPLYQISTTINSDNLALQSTLENLQATLASTPKPQPANQALKDKLILVQKQVSILEGIQPTLAAGHVDWLTTLNVIAGYNPAQITLTGLAQPDNRLLLTGQADDESTVMDYAQVLKDSNRFNRVIVQSITSKSLPAALKTPDDKPKPANKVTEFTISLELKTDSSSSPTR